MKQSHTIILSLILSCCSLPLKASQIEITLAYVGNTNNLAYSGLRLGLDEANLQGQFLNQKYELKTYSSATQFADSKETYLAVIADLAAAELLVLLEAAKHYPVFNISADDDQLRRDCHNNLLSVIPSNRMKQDASAQWQTKHPGTDVVGKAWHPDFVKFAARDLNKRFRKNYSKGMSDSAWAAWAAIRMTADTVARQAIIEPAALLAHMKTNLAFDGQKGMSMNFRETGQLRQPVLIIENGELVGEAPVRGVSGDIDSLGIPECVK
jgi:hypothetical protein